MKVAVSSKGKTLDSELDERFGRAACFILVDLNTMSYEGVENTQNLNAIQGAGIQAAKTVVDHGAGVVITGNCGPKAFAVLSQAGIHTITGVSGKVKDVIEQYKKGELSPTDGPNVKGHWM
ncbi:MAG: NifB/NifX family molybdenum-iron cluster-binding protein [Desulfobacteraceae bacterium]|nr:NifB/NifX family molybdenum-iron cluster-binding protein [Desulfobacteraceae bacterium]